MSTVVISVLCLSTVVESGVEWVVCAITVVYWVVCVSNVVELHVVVFVSTVIE